MYETEMIKSKPIFFRDMQFFGLAKKPRPMIVGQGSLASNPEGVQDWKPIAVLANLQQ